MKIVIISHSSNKYGAELALLEMVSLLNKHHDCIVFIPKNGPLGEDLKKINVKVEISKYLWWVYSKKGKISKLKILSFLNLEYIIFNVRFIINIIYSIITTFKIRKYKPDIILSNSIVINTGIISSILLRKPHIYFIHESVEDDNDLFFDINKKTALKLVNKYSNYIVVVSKILIEKYKTYIDSNKLKLIYLQNIKEPSINETTFWPMPSDENNLKLIIIGNIQNNKNQILAIEALNILKESGLEKIQLLIIGAGDNKYLNNLHSKISKYKLTNQVSFLGYIDNPYPYIKGSDCLLMLSNFESFGRVIIEGMLCKKIIIASNNSGGVLELVKNNITGLLYEKGSISDLSSKIKYLYNNKDTIKDIENNAQDFSQNFHNPDKYLKELDEIIINTLANKNI